VRITFFGATETVTGSKFLVESERARVLVECGLFQGLKRDRLRNREPLPFAAEEIDAVLLTHAHIDHSGLVPLLVKRGFRGPVFCTHATRDLLEVLWPDSGHIQEEDAKHANARGYAKHHPALPLYDEADARAALEHLEVVDRGRPLAIADLAARWTPVGHILGASSIHLEDGTTSLLVSGDVGRPNDPIMRAPATPPGAEWLVVESTYGGRVHPPIDPSDVLEAVARRTIARGGALLVPAFAVGRAQTILHLLAGLRAAGRLPDVPIYLDSPMAIDATRVFEAHRGEHRLDAAACERMCRLARLVNDAETSKKLLDARAPAIIVSASGMATGGRVLHHLARMLPDPAHTVLLVGFQAAGTRGEALASGAPAIKIHGEYVPVRAEIARLDGLSAHADSEELLAWLERFPRAPRRTFVVHGEPSQSDALRRLLRDRLGWDAVIPHYGMSADLR
jgi:metallo-beta-lactamase family protein